MHDALKRPVICVLVSLVCLASQPAQAQDSDFGNLFEGVVEGLMRGAQDDDRHQHHRHMFDDDDDYYDDYGNGYGGGTYRPAAPQKPSAAVDITSPANLAPPKNTGLPEVRRVGVRQMRELELQLQEYIDSAVETLAKSLDPSSGGRNFAQQLVDDLNGFGANPQLVAELERQVRATQVDLAEVDRIGRELGLTSTALDRLEAGYQLSEDLGDLKRLIEDQESSIRIAQAVNSLQRKTRRRLALASKGSETVFRQKLDALNEACLARDLLAERTAPKAPKWPAGEVSVVYDPHTAAGETFLLSDECLLVGAKGRLDELQVGRGFAAALLGLPAYEGPAVPDAPEAAIQPAGLLIKNTTTAPFKYLVDGTQYELPAGFSQKIPLKTAVMKFQNVAGKPAGNAALNSGSYEFRYEPQSGWKIYGVKYRLWVVNKNAAGSFTYLVNNQPATVAPGAEKYHESAWPIIVGFDRGDGSRGLKRFTNSAANQTVVVPGFDAQTNRWDLYPQTAPQVTAELE